MKLLMDSCVWGGDRQRLISAGHDVVWAADWPQDPGDEEILSRAIAQQRVLVTLDKDFGELSVRGRVRHHGIVRLVDISAMRQADVLLQVISSHQRELEDGALITAQPGRLRISPSG